MNYSLHSWAIRLDNMSFIITCQHKITPLSYPGSTPIIYGATHLRRMIYVCSHTLHRQPATCGENLSEAVTHFIPRTATMVKSIIFIALCTVALSSAQIAAGPQRFRDMIKAKSTLTRTKANLKGGNHEGRILELSMSMAFEGIDDAGADDTVAVDWICQFCPTYLCVSCD